MKENQSRFRLEQKSIFRVYRYSASQFGRVGSRQKENAGVSASDVAVICKNESISGEKWDERRNGKEGV